MTYNDAFEESLEALDFRKEKNLGWSVIISLDGEDKVFEGYRGRSTWATKWAAKRAVKEELYMYFTHSCSSARLPHSFWSYDPAYEKLFNDAVDQGKIRIVSACER